MTYNIVIPDELHSSEDPGSVILKNWMTGAYSLSTAIRQFGKTLTVQVISQQLATATTAEQTLLNITEQNSWIREVYLLGDGVPLVQARAVAPLNTYQHFKHELDNLGDKLLGETFIYKLPHTRSPFEFFQVNGLQARRSVFDIGGYKLMVTEVFYRGTLIP